MQISVKTGQGKICKVTRQIFNTWREKFIRIFESVQADHRQVHDIFLKTDNYLKTDSYIISVVGLFSFVQFVYLLNHFRYHNDMINI